MDKKLMTLFFVYNDTHILLGEIKKNGVLNGRINGFGGKVEKGETIEDAAVRELGEEAGIIPVDMKKRGELFFEFDPDGNPFVGKPVLEVHVYCAKEFKGDPLETDEMRPKWFLHSEIPFERMWPDDPHWLPMLLEGKSFKGNFFLKDVNTIASYSVEEVSSAYFCCKE